jgi:hypothetical protein
MQWRKVLVPKEKKNSLIGSTKKQMYYNFQKESVRRPPLFKFHSE